MPLYDFHCEKCNLTKEAIVSSSNEEVQCDVCGEMVKRALVSAHKNYIVTYEAYRPGERPGDKRTRK